MHCSASVNVRKAVCACGHVFDSKKSSPATARRSKRIALNIRRALESADETAARKTKDAVREANKRALVDEGQFLQRRKRNRACTAKKRASETHEEALLRQEHNRARTAKNRFLETRDEALCRQEQDRARTAKKRALESLEDYSQRKQSNRTAMTNKRSKSVSVECAISTFHAEVKLGPDLVCTCCHRMMYRKSVIACNRANYTKGAEVINPRRACAARVTVVVLCVSE